ncbi:hypothetical protein HPB48_021458 [Haemaphysalis longicornis]|uniref:Transposase domain-containing protein n=1 Tax=Haemaphysalis longicornis TaxID=44386 RepID=A0A9J6FYP3_HAELO|nr:hypothetical protein HPB48_021458 [Haemaphysalis longicornis]
MSTPAGKRYRRYLEPGEARDVPEATLRYQRAKRSRELDRVEPRSVEQCGSGAQLSSDESEEGQDLPHSDLVEEPDEVFSSSKASVWPIQLMVNELPFNVRFQNVIVGALWFAKTHPPAHLFVKAFVTALNNMGPITWHCGDECVKSSVYITCCCVDSPARASLLNMNHHGGYFSCPWCLQEGAPVDGTVRYKTGGSPAAPRTHRNVLKDMYDAHDSNEMVRGLKGQSPLILLKGFNLVWYLPPDYMHCVLEGVTQQLIDIWVAVKKYKVKKDLKEVEMRMKQIKPPNSFCRLPRPVKERKNWKATECLY